MEALSFLFIVILTHLANTANILDHSLCVLQEYDVSSFKMFVMSCREIFES